MISEIRMIKMSIQARKRSKGGISTMDLLLIAVLYLATITQGAYGNSTVPNIKAVISKGVNIPCKAYAPEEGDKVQLILWYKEHINKAIYSYDARSPGGRHWVREEALGDRADFVSTVPEPYLRLERVQPQDGGTYTCRVDYKKRQSIRTKATLTVIVPPGDVSIVDSKGKKPYNMKIGPYDEGSIIEVTCLVFEGKPAPTVKWWRHSELLDADVEYANASVSSNTLRFGPLSREHQGILLVCQASNTDQELPISKSVTVDINFKPLSVEIMGDRQPLTAGLEQNITCQSIGAKPAADITWWLDDVDLTDQSFPMEDKEGNVSSSVLMIVPEEDDAGKLLTCKAQSPVINHEPLENPWKLEIFYIPKVTLYMDPEIDSTDIHEGDNVTFICSVEANPEVKKVNWYYAKIRLDENPLAGILMPEKNKLTLREVERQQAGVYSCVASNGIGNGRSQPMLLEVKYAPICSDPEDMTMGAAKGDDVEMDCRVDASPGDVTFKWYFRSGNELIDIEEENFTTQDRTSKLKYHIRTEHDYGEFLCYAKNDLGGQAIPCAFNLVPAGKPDNLENCTLTNQTSDTLYISCIPGFDGGLDQHYVVVVQAYDKEIRGEILRNATETEQPVFVIEGLQPGASYLLAIYAENIKGRSEDSVLHGYTLPANLMNDINVITTHIFPITPILGVLIGVVGALVIVAVVVVVVMKLRSDARSKESNNGGPDTNRKGSHAPLQPAKDGDDGPDVILCRTDPQYEEVDGIPSKLKHANIYETVQCDAKENSKNSEKADCDDVEYAELTFTNGKSKNKTKNKDKKKTGVNGTIHSSEENTIYASIDHTRTAQLNSKQKQQQQNHQEQKQQQQQKQQQPQPLQKQPQGKQPQQQQLLKAKQGIDHLDTAAQGDTDDVPLMDRALESSV